MSAERACPAGRCIGLTDATCEQAQTGVWDVPASFLPADLLRGRHAGRRHRRAAAAAAGGRTAIADRRARRPGRAGHHRRHATSTPPPTASTPHPTHRRAAHSDRDAWEFALLDGALDAGLPVLGICRGAQVLNVALGGTLHQHLPDVVGHNRHQAGNAVFTTSVDRRPCPAPGWPALIGESTDAQCYHHQAIDRLGEGLIVSARDADGVDRGRRADPGEHVRAWPCSGIRRSGSTTCGCSPGSSRRRGRRIATRRRRQRAMTAHANVINPATEEVLRTVDADSTSPPSTTRSRARRPRRSGGPSSPPPSGPPRCGRSPPRSTRTSTSWPRSRWPTPGILIGNAEWEAGHVRDVLQFYSASPERLSGKQIPVAGGLDVTFNEPLGVVGVITPWNFPMTIASWGFAPALAAGNAVLVKPAEMDPADHDPARRARPSRPACPTDCSRCCPARVRWSGSGSSRHPDVRKIVFTGLHRGGHEGDGGCAAQVKRVTLELGGKSANIVFDDCDLERAAATAPYGVFDNAGQDCCARSRILVQRSVYDRFMELLEPAVKGVVVGDPASRDTEMGPLVSRPHCDTGVAYVPDDAPVAFRGSAPTGPGFWFPPTVLTPQRTDRTRHRGDLRPGRHRAAVRRRGRRDRAGQRHRLRPVRIDLDRQPVAGAAGVARAWNPATCR